VLIAIVIVGSHSLHAVNAAAASLILVEPVHGSFITEPQTVVSGRADTAGLVNPVLTVNGTVVGLAADGSFSHPVALDAARIFNPILVELTAAGQLLARRRSVVIAGAALPATVLAPESLGVRLTDRGLGQLEWLVDRAITLNASTFLPPGTTFTQEACVDVPLLPDICTDIHMTIDHDPAPSFNDVEVALDAQTYQLGIQLNLKNLWARARVEAESASCTITVTADSMQVNGAVSLEPNPAYPAMVDAMQVGNMTANFGTFHDETDCGGLLGEVMEGLVALLVGNIHDLLQNGIEDYLNAVNSAGNTPLAAALEGVLSTLSFQTVINDALVEYGLQAYLGFSRITENHNGITFAMDSSVSLIPDGTCHPSPATPVLAASYDVPQPLPYVDLLTPAGALFDVGGVASATLLNQALRAATVCGLLQAEFTELAISGPPIPITAGWLSLFLPPLSQLDPAQPIRVALRPTLAPVISGASGPAGELLDLRIAAYVLELSIPGEIKPILQVALDLRAGIDVQIDPTTGAMRPYMGAIVDRTTTPLINVLGIPPADIDSLIDQLLGLLTNGGTLYNLSEPLVIPPVAGLHFPFVEFNRIIPHTGVFVDIVPQP
jgi:hypothetical protein